MISVLSRRGHDESSLFPTPVDYGRTPRPHIVNLSRVVVVRLRSVVQGNSNYIAHVRCRPSWYHYVLGIQVLPGPSGGVPGTGTPQCAREDTVGGSRHTPFLFFSLSFSLYPLQGVGSGTLLQSVYVFVFTFGTGGTEAERGEDGVPTGDQYWKPLFTKGYVPSVRLCLEGPMVILSLFQGLSS